MLVTNDDEVANEYEKLEEDAAYSEVGSSDSSSAESDWDIVHADVSDIEKERVAVETALKELEEVEAQHFLARAASQVNEIKAARHYTQPDRFPKLQDYKGRHGDYALDYLRALAAQLPHDMQCPDEHLEESSLSQMRGLLEKIYLIVPPRRVRQWILRVRTIYTWQKPALTLKWLFIYLFALLYDIVFAVSLSLCIFYISRHRLFPPRAAHVRKIVKERMKQVKEAQELSKYLDRRQQFGALGASLAASVKVAGLASFDVPKPDAPKSHPTKTKVQKKVAAKQTSNPLRLIRELNRAYGPIVQIALEDSSDLLQKAKNLILWRSARATKRLLYFYSVLAVTFAIVPFQIVFRLFVLYCGFHFFILLRIQDRHPEFRRVLNPFFWMLYGVPTDGDCALLLLQKRNRSKIKSDYAEYKTKQTEIHLRQHKPKASSVQSLPEVTPVSLRKRDRFKKSLSGSAILQKLSPSKDQEKDEVLHADDEGQDVDKELVSSESESGDEEDHSFFCLYKATPGRLYIDAEQLCLEFHAKKGFNRLGKRISDALSNTTPSLKDIAALEYANAHDSETRLVLRLVMTDITGLKKEGNLIEGNCLVVKRSNDVFRFTQLRKRRDEAFSMIVACSPGHFVTI